MSVLSAFARLGVFWEFYDRLGLVRVILVYKSGLAFFLTAKTKKLAIYSFKEFNGHGPRHKTCVSHISNTLCHISL